MKITEEDLESGANRDQQDEEDFLNFNPLTARESVSWDIQIVQAVFERYKNEDPASVAPPADSGKNQSNPESGFVGIPGDADSVIALSHPRDKRKSRIKVVASSSEDEKERKKQSKSVPPVVRRRKSRSGQANKRASGVVYTVSQVRVRFTLCSPFSFYCSRILVFSLASVFLSCLRIARFCLAVFSFIALVY